MPASAHDDIPVGNPSQTRVGDDPPTGAEGSNERAAYLSLRTERDDAGPQILYLEDDLNPHADQRFVDLITSLAPGVRWTPGIWPGWLRVQSAPRLPDPIKIRTCFSKWEGESGLWAIAHDGRRFFTPRNLAALMDVGMAVADEYQYRDERYAVLPTLVYSGRVIRVMTENGVRFNRPPTYFLLEEPGDE